MVWERKIGTIATSVFVAIFFFAVSICAQSYRFEEGTYDLGKIRPRDSVSQLKVGDPAPDFTLPSVSGLAISLSQYRGKKNVVLSFVPAAWTSVCSRQWAEYHKEKEAFRKSDTVLLGITVDNTPTLYSWTKSICLTDNTVWFPVLSDFSPQGEVSKRYGVFRSDAVSERALFVIDKKGIIRFIDVHDINKKPPLRELISVLKKLG
jgi:peroxiredoxin (alkyl hydroperoxide reductase subunit C)